MVSEAIAAGDIHAINYFIAQKYTEAMAAIGTAKNSKIVLMPMEASSLIGSLGGIGAIAKEVFGKNSDAVAAPEAPATNRQRSSVPPASSRPSAQTINVTIPNNPFGPSSER